MLSIFSALGLGRFALGMMLPGMGRALGLSYAEMGYIGTANFVGYFISVAVAGVLARRFGPRRMIWMALVMVGGSMLAVGVSGSFGVILALYMVTGFGSGSANVPVMGLVSAWFTRAMRGRAAGFIVIGSGFAIMFSGWFVPVVNARFGADGWRAGWLVLGGVVLCVAVLARAVIRNRPEERGLAPVGAEAQEVSEGVSAVHVGMYPEGVEVHSMPEVYRLGAIYFLFGYTYVIYATFIVTSLVKDRGMGEAEAGALWMGVGALSLLSGPVFGWLSDHAGRRVGLMLVFGLQAVAYFSAGWGAGEWMLYVSAACFGLTAWSVPSIMAAAVGDCVGSRRAAEGFGFITMIFAVGQVVGPAVAGVLAERGGSFVTSFYMAGAVAVVALVLSATVPGAQAAKELA